MKTIADINADTREFLSAAGAEVVITHDFTGWENAGSAILITETRIEYESQQDLDMTWHRTATITAQMIAKDFDTLTGMINNITEAPEYEGETLHTILIESVTIGTEEGPLHTARIILWAEIWDYDE